MGDRLPQIEANVQGFSVHYFGTLNYCDKLDLI